MKPKKFAVLGDPVAKSLSPVIHHHWFDLLGIDANYHKLAISKGNLATTLPKLAEQGYGGFNITVPLKSEAFRLVATTDGLAQKAEAVNTLYQIENTPPNPKNPQTEPKWAGTNTDVFGITAPLDEAKPNWRTTTQKAVVLGAGGAAAGVLVAIEGISKGMGSKAMGGKATGGSTGEGIAKPTGKVGGNPTREKRGEAKTIVVNRTPKTVYGGIKTTPPERLPEALENADLVINTVPLDFAQLNLKAPASLERLAPGAVVFDIVYTRPSELLAQAGKRGFVVIEGTKMLAYQAQQSFKRWHRITPPVDEALLRVLASHLTEPH